MMRLSNKWNNENGRKVDTQENGIMKEKTIQTIKEE